MAGDLDEPLAGVDLVAQDLAKIARLGAEDFLNDGRVAHCVRMFESPSSLNTALALRQAIWRKEDPRWKVCGIPEVLYTDNGTDFTSRHLEQVSADLFLLRREDEPWLSPAADWHKTPWYWQ